MSYPWIEKDGAARRIQRSLESIEINEKTFLTKPDFFALTIDNKKSIEEEFGVCSVCGKCIKGKMAHFGENGDKHFYCRSPEEEFGVCSVCGKCIKGEIAKFGENDDKHFNCQTLKEKFGERTIK